MRMGKLVATISAVLAATFGHAGDSAPFRLDTVTISTEPLVNALSVSWDAAWIGDDANATVAIEDNGTEVMRTIGIGDFSHVLSGIGRHDLTYTTYIDGMAQKEIYSATFFKDWKYEIKAGGAVIVETSQVTGAVTIPSVIDGYPVTGIAAGVFSGCTNLASVVIPASVWNIGYGAFKGCTGLRRVEAVKGLKCALEAQDAFAGCSQALEIVYASTAEICDVTVKQRFFPWNGKVDITYTLTGDIALALPDAQGIALCVMATNRTDGTFYFAAADALSGDIGTAAGTHHVVWDLNAQGIEFKSEDVVFTVGYAVPQYCVVDLSDGANATHYPVAYMMEPPSGGFNTGEYKTTKLVLRLINPGAFMMQGKYEVVLTRPFYCGIFEVTQRQYELVTGSNPSDLRSRGDVYPVNLISWNMVRGNSSKYDWPSSSNVDSSTFIGRLQARTGLNFDLPTEAQWEYACRAGTTSLYNNGGNTTNDLNQLGRYWDNRPQYGGPLASVGSYLPNAWGLYDMHGNAEELCLDYYGNLTSGMTDPSGPTTGSSRVARGGSCYSAAERCSSSYRSSPPSAAQGFRLARTCSRVEGAPNLAVVSGVRRDDALCVGDSVSVGVNSLLEPTVDYLKISWDAAWIGGDANATVVISDNGVEVRRATGAGEFMHAFSGIGRHELTYTTYVGGAAQDEVYTATVYAKWKYDVKDGGAVVAETTQTAGAITIPSTIDGYPVTGIAEGAFANCSELTSVKIPASVWDVGYAAFGHCTGLQHVEAARGLKSTLEAQDAFEGCSPALEIVYFSTGEIRNVNAKQRFPWNGKVDITYTLTGDIAAGCLAYNQPSLLVTATNRVDGTFYVAATDALSGDTGTTEGPHHVVWDMSAQGLEFKSEDVVFTVAYGYEKYGKYCVIDLSSGSPYPISYLAEVPEGGWTDEYKTTKLVLRLIWPGSFKMGGEYDVTLTKPYYCGVFEVTQKQYELVTGLCPSYFTNTLYCATRPVENISWNAIRGNDSSTNWPSSTGVDRYSFVGLIQRGTGLNFDLPTEAQWEYACRARTVTDYNNGKINMGIKGVDEIGRYSVNSGAFDDGWNQNCSTSAGTAKVGSYLPNAFGLYDMHGNVEEWCLDWYGQLASGVTNPVGSSSGVYRVLRGGGWCQTMDNCTSSFRSYSKPSSSDYIGYNNHFNDSGFRLVGNVSVDVHVVRFDTGRYEDDGGVTFGWGRSFIFTHGSQLGTLLDIVKAPSTNGFHFAGWWTAKEGGTQALPTTKVTSSVTYYPHWTGNAYVVTLDQQSGSGGTTNVTATYGSAMPSVTVPMRTGYMFGGYWSEPNGEGMQYYTASGASALAWDKTNGAILYAKWTEAEKYTVTFDRQGGSGGTASVIAMYGSVMPYIAVPTRTGYAFGGYWSGPNGSGTQYYTPSGTSAHVWDKANATTLYAQWVEQ